MNAQQNMATFSMLLGILSLIMMLFGLGLPAAALGLILAFLSRGGQALLPRAKTGLILSVIGLILSLIITVFSIIFIRSGAFEETFQQMQEILGDSYRGGDSDEMMQELEELFGVTPASGNGGAGK